MTELGLGGCLADDMGLGKTITLIALHLHQRRRTRRSWCARRRCWATGSGRSAGSRPASRCTGSTAAGRALDRSTDGFVLTTYGTMRARRRGAGRTRPWDLLVADEAQHVKNPRVGTARALRRMPAERPGGAHRHPGRERPDRAVGDPRLDHARPARHARRVPDALGASRSSRRRPGRGGDVRRGWSRRSCCAGASPTRASRRSCRRKTETDQPVRAHPRAGRAVRGGRRETLAAIADSRRHARRGLRARAAHRAQADLQPPGPVPQRGGRRRSPAARASWSCSTSWSTRSSPKAARLLVFTQYVTMARLLDAAPRRSRRRRRAAARRHAGRGSGTSWSTRSRGRGAGVPAVAQGGRHRA